MTIYPNLRYHRFLAARFRKTKTVTTLLTVTNLQLTLCVFLFYFCRRYNFEYLVICYVWLINREGDF